MRFPVRDTELIVLAAVVIDKNAESLFCYNWGKTIYFPQIEMIFHWINDVYMN